MKMSLRFPCAWRWLRLTVVVILVVIFTKMIHQSRDGVYSFKERQIRQLVTLKDEFAWREKPTVYVDRRRINMKKSCSAIWRGPNKLDMTVQLRNDLFLDRKHRLAFCRIGKVASTFWTRVLLITSGNERKSSPFDIPLSEASGDSLKHFRLSSVDQIKHILESSTKFIFVRDPYSRLFAAYVDKVFTIRPAYSYLRKQILKVSRWRELISIPENRCATYVTFSEFLKFVIYSSTHGGLKDKHFMAMNTLCHPCEIQYDIVGKMETFMADAEFILNQTEYAGRINIAHERSEIDAISDIVDSVFNEQKDIENENCISFGESLNTVWKKVVIRGIISKQETMPADIFKGNVSREIFRSAIMGAYGRSTNTGERLGNRKAAMVEAYRSIPMVDLKKIQETYRPDFAIFDYDMEPADIYSAKLSKQDHAFFSRP